MFNGASNQHALTPTLFRKPERGNSGKCGRGNLQRQRGNTRYHSSFTESRSDARCAKLRGKVEGCGRSAGGLDHRNVLNAHRPDIGAHGHDRSAPRDGQRIARPQKALQNGGSGLADWPEGQELLERLLDSRPASLVTRSAPAAAHRRVVEERLRRARPTLPG